MTASGSVLTWDDGGYGYTDATYWDQSTIRGVELVEADIDPYSQTAPGTTDPANCKFWFGPRQSGIDPAYADPWGGMSKAPAVEPDEALGAGNSLTEYTSCFSGDPVDNATGNFTESVTDLVASRSGAGGFPLDLTRTYNSLDGSSDGRFGYGWRDSYGWSLDLNDAPSQITVTSDNGSRTRFSGDGSGNFTASSWVLGKLTPVSGGGFTLTKRREVLTFNASGQLTAESNLSGVVTTLTYTSGRLSTVTDQVGRTLTYAYDTSGRVSSVTGPGSRTVTYHYNSSDELTSVEDAAGATTSMTYNSDHQILTVTDPDGGVTTNTYDASGRVATQQDANHHTTTWTYAVGDNGTSSTTVLDADGDSTKCGFTNNVLTSHTVALGTAAEATTTYGYGSLLKPTTVTDPKGNVTTLTYDAHGDLLSKTDAKNQTTTYTYNSSDDRTSTTLPEGGVINYGYDSNGLMTTLTDPMGHATTFTFTALGEVNTITSPKGRVTDYDYDTNGNRVSSTSPAGNQTTYTYDASGWVTSTTSPRGNVSGASPATKESYTSHDTYDGDGRVVTSTDPADTVTANTYDGNGNTTRTTVTDANAAVLSDQLATYDGQNRQLTSVNVDQTVLTNTYDPVGNLLTSTDGTGATTSYTYDAANQATTMTTARGNVAGATAADYTWHYLYDLDGNRTEVDDPAGRAAKTSYDDVNEPVTSTTPRGKVTTTAYDHNGRITSVTDPLGNATNYTYDADDRITDTALPGQAATHSTYDNDGNQTSQTSPTGASETSWTYTDDGQVHTQVDPDGNVTGGTPANYTTTDAYDPDGNLTTQTDQLGRATTWTYDALDNQTSKTTPRGQTTTWTYDGLNRLTSVVPPGSLGGDTSYAYNKYGDLVTLTDDAAHTKTYEYNARHQVTKVTDQLGRPRTYGYDADGNLTSWVTARGYASGATASDWTVHQSFDSRGLLTGRTTSNSGVNAGTNTAMSYDDDGDLTGMVDGTGTGAVTSSLVYDADGRLTSVTQPQGTYGYTYNAAGQVATRTYPASGTITYGYNGDGLETSLAADSKTTSFGYDANQQLTTITYPTSVGLVQTRAYDQVGQVASVLNKKTGASTPISKFEYSRDLSDNPIKIKTTRGTTVTNDSYTYNQKDGLLKYCPGVSSCTGAANYIGYSYASTGNGHRSVETRVGVSNPGTNTYTYDAADQLTKKVAAPSGGTTTTTNYTYTADGQPTSDGRTWNVLGQLAASNLTGPGSATYTYDGLGNRRTVTTSSGTKKLSWDINNPMPMLGVITDPTGNTSAQRYDPVGDILETQHPAGTYASSYYGHDQLGSVTDVLEGNGTPAWNYAYEPFGSTIAANSLVTGAVNTNFGYTSAYQETALGNQYALRARDYDPALGRFATTDPIAPALTDAYISPYLYANDQPTVLTDPTGLSPFSDLGGHIAESASSLWNGTRNAAESVGSYVAGHTEGVCANGSAAAGPYATVSSCFVYSGGHLYRVYTVGAGGGSPAASLSAGFLFSNAANIDEFKGFFGQAGGSIGEGPSLGDEISLGLNSCGRTIWENQASIGISANVPLPFEGHAAITYTLAEKIV